jgi:flagellar basal body-associated protein FliL
MTDVFLSVLSLAADTGPGRGDNPDAGGGVLIIVAIVVVVLLAGLALAFFFSRGRARRAAMTRTPAPDGRVGRVSEFKES